MREKSQIRLVARFSLSLKMTQYTNWFFSFNEKWKEEKFGKRKTFNRLLIENAKNKSAIMSPPVFFFLFR